MKKLIFTTILSGFFVNTQAQIAKQPVAANLKIAKATSLTLLKKVQRKPGKMVQSFWFDNEWDFADTNYYEYNSAGRITKETTIRYDGSIRISNNSYFESGKTKSIVRLFKSSGTANFDTSEITVYTLDAKGNFETLTQKFYTNGQFNSEYITKNIITYGANHRIENYIEQIWNDDKNAFENQIKIDVSYDTEGKVTSLTINKYDTTGSTFTPIERYANITWQVWEGNIIDLMYGESNALVKSLITEEYDETSWIVSGRSNFTYNNKNHLLTNLDESFDGSNYDTSYFENNILTYNSNDDLTERITQYWDRETRSIMNAVKENYSDFIVVNSVTKNNINSNAITVFPNPATHQVTFTGNNTQNGIIIITDLIGKTIASTAMENGTAVVNKDQINAGIYIYQIISNNQIVSAGKLIFN
jgi:hypothetical protein